MAKPRSPKLRTFITMHALFKHSDERNRLNSIKLNDFLRPFRLECNPKIIGDTAQKLNEAGIETTLAGGGPSKGYAFANRPLPDHELNQLIYAIDTSPFLSTVEAQELLSELGPAVTVFQEPMLKSVAESPVCPVTGYPSKEGMRVQDYHAYYTIHEAIAAKQRVCISKSIIRVNNAKKSFESHLKRADTYLPRYLIHHYGEFYMIGYNHSRQRIEAVRLRDITGIRTAIYNNLPEVPQLLEMLESIDPSDYLPENHQAIYEGPAVFHCGAKFFQLLYGHFGPPCSVVQRDNRYRLTYPVSGVTITTETLRWLGDIPGNGIRILGPEALVEAVDNYCQQTQSNLLNTQHL